MSNETANAIRKVVVGTIVAEYGLMQIRDNSKQELKQKTNFAINAIKKVQDYFITHPNSTPEHREIFKKEFIKSEIFMISELLEAVWGLSDDSLEEIVNTIRANTISK